MLTFMCNFSRSFYRFTKQQQKKNPQRHGTTYRATYRLAPLSQHPFRSLSLSLSAFSRAEFSCPFTQVEKSRHWENCNTKRRAMMGDESREVNRLHVNRMESRRRAPKRQRGTEANKKRPIGRTHTTTTNTAANGPAGGQPGPPC